MSMCDRISALPLTPAEIERKTGGISADPLPGLHLALIALFRNLRVEIDRRQRMHDERRKGRGVGARLRRHQLLPMRVAAFAQAGDDADAGDPGFALRRQPSASASIPGKPIRVGDFAHLLRHRRHWEMPRTRKVSSASQIALPSQVMVAFGDRIAGAVMGELRVDRDKRWPGVTKVRNFASLTAARNGMRSKRLSATKASLTSAPWPRSAARPASTDSRENGLRRSCFRSEPWPHM